MSAHTDADVQALMSFLAREGIACGPKLSDRILDAVAPAIAARAQAEALDAAVDAIRHNERECLVEHTCHLADIISLGHRAAAVERTP